MPAPTLDRALANTSVETVERLDLVGGELEVEDVEILGDASRLTDFGIT